MSPHVTTAPHLPFQDVSIWSHEALASYGIRKPWELLRESLQHVVGTISAPEQSWRNLFNSIPLRNAGLFLQTSFQEMATFLNFLEGGGEPNQWDALCQQNRQTYATADPSAWLAKRPHWHALAHEFGIGLLSQEHGKSSASFDHVDPQVGSVDAFFVLPVLHFRLLLHMYFQNFKCQPMTCDNAPCFTMLHHVSPTSSCCQLMSALRLVIVAP